MSAPKMPSLRNHRRHHSWPHCGSEICMREPRRLELRVSKPGTGSPGHTPWYFQQAAVVPLIMEELADDDAEMAGIVPSQMPRTHRIWSRPLLKDRNEDLEVSESMIEARKHVHRSLLRRLIRRPPLDKTRSLFVMPTINTRDQFMISGWMPPRSSARPIAMTSRRPTVLSVSEDMKFHTERRHRRCHSEQPRAWRRPSATLWTLQEEGGNEETGPANRRIGV
jgi:hypothetical protein